MKKMVEYLEKYLLPIADKISNQRHLQAVRDGLVLVMPLTIVGSIFLVIANLPIKGYSDFMTSIFGAQWASKLAYPVNVTMDVMAIFACVGIAYRLAKSYKVDSLSASAIALACYFIVTPFSINFTPKGATESLMVKGMPIALMGSKGLFVVIIVSLISTEIYRKIIQKNIVIKMPEGVPPTVSKSFAALIPAAVCITFFWLIRIGLEQTSYNDIHVIITKILSEPLGILGNSLGGAILYVLFVDLFWSFGIHGSAVVGSVMTPILTTLNDANRMAFQAGQAIPNTINSQFFLLWIFIGGGGATLVFTVLILYKARSKQLKKLGRLSIGSGIFNINEPIIFGTPIIMNPIIMIPFILVPIVLTVITYFAMEFGLVAKAAGISVPWTTPVIISGYLATGGKISGAVMQIVNFIIAMVIYYPFFRMWDREKLKEEEQELEVNIDDISA